jgi:integrase
MSDGYGMYVLVQPNGSKLFRFGYRFGGKQKLLALGRYPVTTLAMARDKHMDARRLIAQGIDPAAQRQAEKTAGTTFRDVAEQWYTNWRTNKSVRYGDYVGRRLKDDIYPAIGSLPIAKIEAPAIVGLCKGIEARGAYEIARKTMGTIGQVFRFGVAHGHCQRNPVADVRPADVFKPTTKGHHATVEVDKLPSLLRAMYEYQGTAVTKFAMRLTAYTVVRTGELLGAEWSEVNLDAAEWRIPLERMKMRTPHIVLLSPQAVEILRAIYQLTGRGKYVFPGNTPSKPLSNMAMLKGLQRIGFGGAMTMHGWRSIFSTQAHEKGWPHEHIELCLAHQRRNKVAASYDFATYLEPRRELMHWWADWLDEKAAKEPVLIAAD